MIFFPPLFTESFVFGEGDLNGLWDGCKKTEISNIIVKYSVKLELINIYVGKLSFLIIVNPALRAGVGILQLRSRMQLLHPGAAALCGFAK